MTWRWSCEITSAPWYADGRALVMRLLRWRLLLIRLPEGEAPARIVLKSVDKSTR
jgi:hypothetical protein